MLKETLEEFKQAPRMVKFKFISLIVIICMVGVIGTVSVILFLLSMTNGTENWLFMWLTAMCLIALYILSRIPITGCTKGCDYCYARKMATNPFYAKAFPYKFEPHFYPERIRELCKIPAGSKVFVCSMGELFGDNPEWTKEVFLAIENHPKLTFQLLTKRPENLIKWEFPDNVWIGASATDASMFTKAWEGLKDVKANVKFISFEPLLNWDMSFEDTKWTLKTAGINWIIIGQRTPHSGLTEPCISWIAEIVESADNLNIPVFLKNNLQDLLPHIAPFVTNPFRNTILGLRQEFPKSEVK
jgi:protein gp37